MLLIDEKKLSKAMLEDLGHVQGVDDTGLSFDEYIQKVIDTLQYKGNIVSGRAIHPLTLNGLRVYTYSTTGKPMTSKAYAEWMGVKATPSVYNEFSRGLADVKEQIAKLKSNQK